MSIPNSINRPAALQIRSKTIFQIMAAPVQENGFSGPGFRILLGAILAMRLAAVFAFPFGQSVRHGLEGLNDEPAHYNYVKYIAQHHAFPKLEHWVTEKDAFVRSEFEFHQAPLYYVLCAPLVTVLGGQSGLYACRLLSALCGILGLWVIVLLLRDLGCGRHVRAAAVMFAGLLPSYLYFCSFASNDALSWLAALLVTRELVRHGTAPEGRFSLKSFGALALYLAAGALTKSSLLIFFPVAAGVFAYRFQRSKNRPGLMRGCACLCLAGLAILPWYLRNIFLYHSLLGTPHPTAAAPLSLTTLTGLVKGSVKFFWFPMQNLQGGTAAFLLLGVLGAAVLAAHMAAAVVWFVKKRHKPCGAPAVLFLAILGVNGAAYLWYFLQWLNPEARFLFPSLGPLVFFMMVPARSLFSGPRLDRLFLPYVFCISIFPYFFLAAV